MKTISDECSASIMDKLASGMSVGDVSEWCVRAWPMYERTRNSWRSVVKHRLWTLRNPDRPLAKRPWTIETTETLRTMAARGCSAAQIADALAEKHGLVVSKNAVIGRASRAKIPLSQTHSNGLPRSAVEREKIITAALLMYDDDIPVGKIADKLGVHPRSIFGVISRAKSSSRHRTDEYGARMKLAHAATAKVLAGEWQADRYETLSAAAVDGETTPVSLIDLEPSHCRWPMGGGFCGRPRAIAGSYCAGHMALGYLDTSGDDGNNTMVVGA